MGMYVSGLLSVKTLKLPPYKLEFLALKWAVVDKFNFYLYGGSFKVFTDNNPLTYIHRSLKVDATSQRWLAALGEYDFSIHYMPGTTNVDADILSRLHESSDVSVEHISAVTESTDEFAQYIDISDLDEEMLAHVNSLKTPFDWRALQLEDSDLALAR